MSHIILLSSLTELWPEEKLKYFITNSDPGMVGRDQSMESGEMVELPFGLASFHRKFRLCSYAHFL